MTYITTGSSNSVTNGSPLDLLIKISNDSLSKILLKGRFTIEGFNKIAIGDDLENLTCKLSGKTDDTGTNATSPVDIQNFKYDPNNPGTRQIVLPRKYKDQFIYLELEIKGGKCTIQDSSTELKLLFKDSNQSDEVVEIDFKIEGEQAKPEIISFSVSPTVLQGNTNPVHLTWTMKGENYTYRILDGLKELTSGNGTSTQTDTKDIISIPIGDHAYTLEVTQGSVTVTKTVLLRALDLSDLSLKGNPPPPYLIGNMCVSQDSEYLFSLMLNDIDQTNTQIDHIGYTHEGFSGQWSKFELLPEDIERLKPFANATMVHLKNAQDTTYGRLFFIGGSYVKPMECQNALAIVDLDFDPDTGDGSMITIHKDLPWASRMGHSAVVFPHGSVDKIWLMSGINEWGEALNDVWVSGDGKKWENVDKNEAVNSNSSAPKAMDWASRCFSGISIELDENRNKKALWIGGGFSEVGGKETADIWKMESKTWRKIQPLIINDASYRSSGLAFLGKDTVDSTGIFLLGGYLEGTNRKKYSYKINLINGKYSTEQLDTSSGAESFATTKNARIITFYFKGCLWYMVFTDEGDMGMTYSKLYYYVPVVTGRTLILS